MKISKLLIYIVNCRVDGLVLLLLVLGPCLAAANVNEKNKKLVELQQRIERMTQQLRATGTKKQELIKQLATIESEYGRQAKSIRALNQQVQLKQQELAKLDAALSDKENQIARQRDAMQAQLRTAYALGDNDAAKLMLNQQDPLISSRILIYYGYFNKARLKRLNDFNDQVQSLQALEKKKKQESGDLQNILQDKIVEQALLHDKMLEREKILASLEREMSAGTRTVEKLTAEEKQLKSIIAALNQASEAGVFQAGPDKPFSKLRGQLAWPVQGAISNRFGSKRVDGRWDGVVIAAAEGTNVHAATRGTVVYSDWLRGYGLLTIIDHTGGFMTLYAFNQSLHAEAGDQVQSGDIIATVGRSGGRKQSGLYFGIRKNGKPLDPAKWCRKAKKGRVG